MILFVILIYLTVLTFSWLLTCGIVKLICLCLGIIFTWKLGTAVWILMTLLRIFKRIIDICNRRIK